MSRVELEFFPFFVDAFLSATATWPAQRVGAYVRLLSHQWKHGSVPGDAMDELHRIILEPIDVSTALWERLAVKFPKGDAGYQNLKLEEVRADVLRRMKGNKKKTKKATEAAAEARRSRPRTVHGSTDGERHGAVTDTDMDPLTSGNLKSGNEDSERQNPKEIPPNPPADAGGPTDSVTVFVSDKDITRKERAEAESTIEEFGCPHAHPEADPPVPECETHQRCVGRLVGEARAQERQGLEEAVR